VKSLIIRAAIAALCALSLAGCIDSAAPILTDAQPVLGPKLNLQLYSLRKGYAHEPEQATYTWNGARYAHASGGMKDIPAFTVHPFEADGYIVQTVPAKPAQKAEYGVMRTLADGVYLVTVIDEDDADAATRAAHCKHPGGAACRIQTREQLFAFARATAARHKNDGGLAIRLAD
jgi:hypothetical protein